MHETLVDFLQFQMRGEGIVLPMLCGQGGLVNNQYGQDKHNAISIYRYTYEKDHLALLSCFHSRKGSPKNPEFLQAIITQNKSELLFDQV
jgi:hypothetical protein